MPGYAAASAFGEYTVTPVDYIESDAMARMGAGVRVCGVYFSSPYGPPLLITSIFSHERATPTPDQRPAWHHSAAIRTPRPVRRATVNSDRRALVNYHRLRSAQHGQESSSGAFTAIHVADHLNQSTPTHHASSSTITHEARPNPSHHRAAFPLPNIRPVVVDLFLRI